MKTPGLGGMDDRCSLSQVTVVAKGLCCQLDAGLKYDLVERILARLPDPGNQFLSLVKWKSRWVNNSNIS